MKCATWRNSLHTDHVVPTWQGGSDTADNYQYLCANCHEDKTFAERATSEYREYVSRQVKERMLSSEARQRISNGVRRANERRVWTSEARAKCATRKGPIAPETRMKIANALRGKSKSEAHKTALSAAAKRRRTWPILVN